MSSYMQNVGAKLFAKHIEQYAPEDPMYEVYTDERGRQKRKKRAIPPGLSPRDAKILKSVQRRAHYLDKSFSVCGLRFGWTVIIGLVPVVGDSADFVLSYCLVLRKARQAELPGWLVRRMLMNCIISATAGIVPAVGDVIVGMYKANSRNAALLEEFLRIRGEEFLKVQTEAREGKRDGGLSKKDVEQVKPGAGMESATGQPSTSSASGAKTGRKKEEN
ncbi:hypothetical protein EDC04DRAFT_2693964 [Pisolithus marmoratus]|nr:hypothetical protein EDC04DRAFT_2693964 [Pisolithus marmoratus]